MAVLYLDSSALFKLVIRERETAALVAFLVAWPNRATSALAPVEVGRAVRRAKPAADVLNWERLAWEHTALLALAPVVLEHARRLDPPALRSLDAIHLASALSLGADLGGMVAYDRRLLAAARARGIATWSPGSAA